MPRDGSGQYGLPFPDVVEGTTIESTVYNGFTNDVAQDLNAPRPIVAGGTGANNAHDAMIALSGEIASQAVTNYDSFPFVAGSFISNPGATAAPAAGPYFLGVAYGAGDNITLEARELINTVPGRVFVRQKQAGVWGAWAEQPGSQADNDARYVNVTGDTMTGTLTLTDATTPTNGVVYFGNTATKYFGNFGGNYLLEGGPLYAYSGVFSGAGTSGRYTFGSSATGYLNFDGTNFTLAGGNLFTSSGIYAAGEMHTGYSTATAVLRFSSAADKYLNYDGTLFNLIGGTFNCGPVVANGAVYAASSTTAGAFHFGTSGTKFLQYDGTNFNLEGGGAFINAAGSFVAKTGGGNMHLSLFDTASGYWKYIRNSGGTLEFINHANTLAVANLTDGGHFSCYGSVTAVQNITAGEGYVVKGGSGFYCRSGGSGPYGGNYFNLNYVGPVQMWIDVSNLGNITITSDYRTKKDVAGLSSMWDTVKALRPIKYTQANFTPPAQIAADLKAAADARAEAEAKGEQLPAAPAKGPMFVANDIEQWGFIAHELQDTLLPSAATGVKDSPDYVQSPNPFTVIAALTKALQEAMARIEALEAAA